MATSGTDLINKLKGNPSFIFTLIQKFNKPDEQPIYPDHDILIISDEAHRSQYGLTERIKMITNEEGEQEARRVIGTARIIRDCLPNATFIGFTGTPVSSRDHNTRAVFGDYIDVYDMTQAVEDGATRPVYYESRVVKLHLNEETLKQIDEEYDLMAASGQAD